MKRNAIVVAAAILAVLAVGSVSRTRDAMGANSVSEMKAGEHDLTGMWEIDSLRSDAPRKTAEGLLVTYAKGGKWFLPRVFRIGVSDRGMALSDSTGTILQVIMYMKVTDGDGERMPPRFTGAWKKDKLIVYRPGRPGTKLTQTFSLEEEKRVLVVTTKMHREHGSDVSIKRVYVRAGA
jgi:hypothetical protein